MREVNLTTEVSSHSRVAETRAKLVDLLGTMVEGQAMPSERVLAEQWSVSRVTLRAAVDRLVNAGLLTRRQGAGTYVTRPRLSRRLTMTSFTEDIQRRGMTPSTRVLELKERRADRLLCKLLRVPIGDRVISFTRLRLADGEPMAIERSSIAQALVPGLTTSDLEGSWYETLAGGYGIHIESASFDVVPILPDAQTANWLAISPSQPCLQLTIVSLDGSGRVVEAGASTYRGDTYSLSAELGTQHYRTAGIRNPFA